MNGNFEIGECYWFRKPVKRQCTHCGIVTFEYSPYWYDNKWFCSSTCRARWLKKEKANLQEKEAERKDYSKQKAKMYARAKAKIKSNPDYKLYYRLKYETNGETKIYFSSENGYREVYNTITEAKNNISKICSDFTLFIVPEVFYKGFFNEELTGEITANKVYYRKHFTIQEEENENETKSTKMDD